MNLSGVSIIFVLFLFEFCESNNFNCDRSNDEMVSVSSLNVCTEAGSVAEVEQTLVLLKPDAVKRKLVGEIIKRFENKGLKMVGSKLFLATREMAEEHYIEHKNKHFFERLMNYMTSNPMMPMIWEGPNAIKVIRNMLGVHDPTKAMAGTIRGDYSIDIQNNVIHGADSPEAAQREINIWFHKNEIMPHTDSDY